MQVFLTGATGFIGAHIARSLLQGGHRVRMLVRNRDAAVAYFARHGHTDCEFIVGDMLDAPAVKTAMTGCDAVLHAAAMVSLEAKDADTVYRTNIASIESVIGGACELGMANIVYVSSLSVLFQPGISTIDENTPLGRPAEAYARSKRDSDDKVRSYQAAGHPVQLTYPSGVIGPDDPKLSESNAAFKMFLNSIPITSSGIQTVDVRDVAAMHVYLLEHPPLLRDARFIIGGHYLHWAEFHRLVSGVTGNDIAHPTMPGWLFRLIGRVIDVVKKVKPLNTMIGKESMEIVTRFTPASSSKILQASGLDFRPLEETVRDTTRWLLQEGHISTRRAGRVASAD